jgi:hypothetical protein
MFNQIHNFKERKPMRLRSSSSTVWSGLFLGLFALVVLCGTQALAADSDVYQRVRVIVDGKDDVRKLMSDRTNVLPTGVTLLWWAYSGLFKGEQQGP